MTWWPRATCRRTTIRRSTATPCASPISRPRARRGLPWPAAPPPAIRSRRSCRTGAAVRIFTGAPMPAGADTVLMQEDCEAADDGVVIPAGIAQGRQQPQGGRGRGQGRARAGGRAAGCGPQDVGLAASLGLVALRGLSPAPGRAVLDRRRGARAGRPTLPAGCVYDANRYALAALLEGLGCAVDDLGILPDRPDAIRDALAARRCHARRADHLGRRVGRRGGPRARRRRRAGRDPFLAARHPAGPAGRARPGGRRRRSSGCPATRRR